MLNTQQPNGTNGLGTEIKHKILVVDDEPQIRKFLRVSLNAYGYDVVEAENGAEAVRLTASVKPDLLVLDLGLPELDGQQVILKVREWSAVPIIVLSVRSEEQEKTKALDNGADDYVVKPFGVEELIARVRSVLRRVAKEENAGETSITCGPLNIDLLSRKVSVNGEVIKLSPKEFKLIKYLAMNEGKVLTHRQLLKEVWGEAYTHDNQYLRVYMGQLRKKIDTHPEKSTLLHTEQGVGYRLAVD